MSDVDVIIKVHTQGVQEIGNLSASLRNLSNTLRGVSVPMSKLDAHTKAVHKALGMTSRGVGEHAKSIKGLIQNQRVLGTETKNIARDLNGLRNAYALAGRETTALGRSIGVTTKELSAFSRTFRGMRLRAIGSDFHNISQRLSKLGKDAQFVGRSLMINLTLPIAAFGRIGLQNFLSIEKQSTRLIKVMEQLAMTMDQAMSKVGVQPGQIATAKQTAEAENMVNAFKELDSVLTNLSIKFGVSKELVVGLAADFAELGLTSEKSVSDITELTLQIEKLGTMDIGPAQDLSQALFFQSKRAFEVTRAFDKLTTSRQREEKAIKASITQMHLFNAIENVTALTLQDLGQAFPEIAAMATSYGLSMTEAAAMLAPMKAAGLDIGASSNSIKVSLQRLLAPTKQNIETIKRLSKQYGVAGDANDDFILSTKTGLTGLGAVVKMFDKVRSSSQGQEGALRLMSDLFEKRQGPRMYLAIEQLADFNKELENVKTSADGVVISADTAERQLADAAESVVMNETFKNFNSKIVPKTIRSFEDIGRIARIASAYDGQQMEIKGVKFNIGIRDIELAKAMRDATSDLIKTAKEAEGRDIIAEVQTETGRALMVQLAGATNAAEVAEKELARTLATAGTSVEQIRTVFKQFAADVIESLIPTLKKLAAKVVEMYAAWSSQDFAETRQRIIKLITVLGSFLAIMGPLTLAVGTLQSVFGKLGMGLIKFFPKLKTVDGGFVGLGRSAELAKTSVNNLYKSVLKMAGIRSASPAGALSAVAGAPLMPREVTPAIRQKMLNDAKREAMRAAGVSASQQRQAAREIKDGVFPPASGSRARSARTGRMLPAKVVEAMQIIQARDLADVTPGPTGVLRDSRGRNVSPTSKAAVLRNKAAEKIARQQEMFTASPFFKKAGIETDRDGTQFVRKGRQITEAQAKNLGAGGLGAVKQRALLAVGRVKDVSLSPMTGTKKALDAARASQAALAAQMTAMGKDAPGRFRMVTTGIMGFVKSLKIATIAGRILRMTLLMTGIGAIIALVAGAVFLIVKNIDKIKGSAKGMASLKNAFNAIKDAAMMIVRPVQDLFAMFGSGKDEGEKAGNGIAAAFDGLAKGIEFVAGIFKLFVEKVIQPYLYGIVNIVLAVVAIFKGNWGDAFKYLIAGVGSVVKGVINLFVGLGSGIVTVIAKAITVVLDLFGEIPIIGNVFKIASAGVNKLASASKSLLRGVGDFAISGLDKAIDLGIKKSANKLKTAKTILRPPAKDAGDDMGEAIADAFGNAPIEDAADKIGKAVKDGMADKAQELYDYVVGRFGDAIKKFVSDTVKALNKQKESALKVFDIQINTLMKLEKAEESLTRTKQYETDRRRMIDDATLRQEVYRRDRALAIYEGRTDDARILDIEESKASNASTGEIASLDDSRRKDLAKENLDALREAIGEAKELASKFFDESIAKFQESAEFITRIAPVTIEQYTAQLEELRLKTLEHSDKNNVEFGNMFQKFTETIHSRMPNTVDQFGLALGAFAGPLDELVNLAMSKYGLGSDADNTVLGVTKQMSDSVIGITLGMLVDIGGVFTTEAPAVIEQFGKVTGGLKDKTGAFSIATLGLFTTLLSEVKLQFITPFQAALDAAEPMKVYKQAIIDGNTEILNSFKKTLELNPDLMKKIKASLDPAIRGYLELKAAANAAKDAMDDAAGGGAGSSGLTDAQILRAQQGNRTDAQGRTGFGYGGQARAPLGPLERAGFTGPAPTPRFAFRSPTSSSVGTQEEQLRAAMGGRSLKDKILSGVFNSIDILGFAVGGPVPKGGVLGMDGLGVTGFLNAPATQGIPAILHGGEFVINSDAVKRVGLGALTKINDARIPKFKKGGLVGDKNKPKETLGYTADRINEIIKKPKTLSGGMEQRLADGAERRVLAAQNAVLNSRRTIGPTADSMERIINNQPKRTLGYTADNMEKIIGRQVQSGSADSVATQRLNERVGVNNFLKSISTPPPPVKDTRGKFTKALDFMSSVPDKAFGHGGLIEKAPGFVNDMLQSLSNTVIRVPATAFNLLGAISTDIGMGKFNPIRNYDARAKQLYNEGIHLKIGNQTILRTTTTGDAAMLEDLMNVIPVGAGGVIAKLGGKLLMRAGSTALLAGSGSSALNAAGFAALKTGMSTGGLYAVRKAQTQAILNKLGKQELETNFIPTLARQIRPDAPDLRVRNYLQAVNQGLAGFKTPIPELAMPGSAVSNALDIPNRINALAAQRARAIQFKDSLLNPIDVTTRGEYFPGYVDPLNIVERAGVNAYKLKGQYFNPVPGVVDKPVGFGFNLPDPRKAFPDLPKDIDLLQAQPFEIFDFAQGLGKANFMDIDLGFNTLMTKRIHAMLEQDPPFSARFHKAFNAKNNIPEDQNAVLSEIILRLNQENFPTAKLITDRFSPSQLTKEGLDSAQDYSLIQTMALGMRDRGKRLSDDIEDTLRYQAESGLSTPASLQASKNKVIENAFAYGNFRGVPFNPDLENFTAQQIDFTYLAALKGNEEAQHIVTQFLDIGKKVKANVFTDIRDRAKTQFDIGGNKGFADIDRIVVTREEYPEFPMTTRVGDEIQIRTRAQLQYSRGADGQLLPNEILDKYGKPIERAVERNTYHTAINHLVGGGTMGGRPNIPGADMYLFMLKDMIEANPGALASIHGADTFFTPRPFKPLILPADKVKVFRESLEYGPNKLGEKELADLALKGARSRDIVEAADGTISWRFDETYYKDHTKRLEDDIAKSMEQAPGLIAARETALQAANVDLPFMQELNRIGGIEFTDYGTIKPRFDRETGARDGITAETNILGGAFSGPEGIGYKELHGKFREETPGLYGTQEVTRQIKEGPFIPPNTFIRSHPDYDFVIPPKSFEGVSGHSYQAARAAPGPSGGRVMFPDVTQEQYLAAIHREFKDPGVEAATKALRENARIATEARDKLRERLLDERASGYHGSPLKVTGEDLIEEFNKKYAHLTKPGVKPFNVLQKHPETGQSMFDFRNELFAPFGVINEDIPYSITRNAVNKAIDQMSGNLRAFRGAQHIGTEQQQGLNFLAANFPVPVQSTFHPDHASKYLEYGFKDFERDGILGVGTLGDFPYNLIASHFGSDSSYVRNYQSLLPFPGKFTRLEVLDKKPFNPLKDSMPEDIPGIDMDALYREMNKELVLRNIRKSADKLLIPDFVSSSPAKIINTLSESMQPPSSLFTPSFMSSRIFRSPIDDGTSLIPPAIKPPPVARSFSDQMEIFRALQSLASAKNVPLRPYQQVLVEEYTNSFNKLLTLRALDLSGDKTALEAYVSKLTKLYGVDGGFGHPIKPNSGVPIMEKMEASGMFSGFLPFMDVLDNPEVQQMMDVLMRDMNDAMKAGSVVYPEDIQTYRGIALMAPTGDPRKYLDHLYRPGYTLPGQYASTSINEEVAKGFSGGPFFQSNPFSSGAQSIPILEHITIPKGNEVFSPSYYGLGLQNEREIIIPPKYRLRIDDILEPDAGGNGYYRIKSTAVKAAAIAGIGGVGLAGASMLSTPNQVQAMTADTMERVETQKVSYYAAIRRLNEFIAGGETKNASDPYNAIHSRMHPVADLTSMTIRQAIDFANEFKSKNNSSGAIGKYQNLPEFLSGRAGFAGFGLDSLYDEKTQELIAQSFLLKSFGGNGIGLESYFGGKKSEKYMINRIANIYRGMPGSDGKFVGEGSNKKGSDLNMLGNLKNYLSASKALYMPGFKKGGYVPGVTSTAIPAMLHGGEYVLNAKAVQQLGLPYLNMMNQVSQSQFRPPTSRVNAPSGAVTNNVSTVNIQVENFVGEEAWFESMMKEYNINVLPKNQKLAGLEQRKFSSYNGINQGL